jgi:hypothetical protein
MNKLECLSIKSAISLAMIFACKTSVSVALFGVSAPQILDHQNSKEDQNTLAYSVGELGARKTKTDNDLRPYQNKLASF